MKDLLSHAVQILSGWNISAWQQPIKQICKPSRTHRTECEQGEVSQICLETKLQDGTTQSPGWIFMFLQTTDVLTSVCFIVYIPHWHFYKTSHITFTLHVHDLTVIFGGRRDGGGVTGERVAKPVTAETSGQITAMLESTKPGRFCREVRAVFVAAKTGVLGVFPIVPKPNQSIGTL